MLTVYTGENVFLVEGNGSKPENMSCSKRPLVGKQASLLRLAIYYELTPASANYRKVGDSPQLTLLPRSY